MPNTTVQRAYIRIENDMYGLVLLGNTRSTVRSQKLLQCVVDPISGRHALQVVCIVVTASILYIYLRDQSCHARKPGLRRYGALDSEEANFLAESMLNGFSWRDLRQHGCHWLPSCRYRTRFNTAVLANRSTRMQLHISSRTSMHGHVRGTRS